MYPYLPTNFKGALIILLVSFFVVGLSLLVVIANEKKPKKNNNKKMDIAFDNAYNAMFALEESIKENSLSELSDEINKTIFNVFKSLAALETSIFAKNSDDTKTQVPKP